LHSLMDPMTDHWGHLLTAPDPEAGEEPPQGGEVVADHEEPAGEGEHRVPFLRPSVRRF
jgi:hypothetical protein